MRPNNFDFLRLIAALSVVYFHTIHRLNIDINLIFSKFFSYIPGVPIFFFISGFLISLSYSRSISIKAYMKNRILRIYPALYICLFLSILSVFYIDYFDTGILGTQGFWLWILSQITFVQFYNPEFLRGYGVGSLNGSLWTISVELQFYALIPILYKFITSTNKNKILIMMIVLFSIFNIIFQSFNSVTFRDQTMIYKLFHVSFIPWFYMFLIGVLFQENFNKIKVLYEMYSFNKIIYIALVLYLYNFLGMNPVTFLLFVSVIFIFIFSLRDLSSTILKGNDYSYGIYIYHAPIVNYFLYNNYVADVKYLFLVILISTLFAYFSWHVIEKPILGYKDKWKK